MMIPTKRSFESVLSLLLCLLQSTTQVSAGTQFASHVSVNTPARSFTHGVGDPLSVLGRKVAYQRPSNQAFNSLRHPAVSMHTRGGGYPRVKPTVPFTNEEISHDNSLDVSPWRYNNYMDVNIPLLPPSPYKVDSPDPESLWPEGLFLPPITTPRFGYAIGRRSSNDYESEYMDPYRLEGSEAIAAVVKAKRHGELYFHDIPHIESLLANQELRVKNQLKPHRLGSIRHTWPYNRP